MRRLKGLLETARAATSSERWSNLDSFKKEIVFLLLDWGEVHCILRGCTSPTAPREPINLQQCWTLPGSKPLCTVPVSVTDHRDCIRTFKKEIAAGK